MSNQEKVWMAEQQKEADETKLKEIQKQIQVEREREELERISGRISSKIDRGIDWMYEGGAKEEDEMNKEAESYLLGKSFEGVSNDDLVGVGSGGVDTIVSSVVEHEQPEEYQEQEQDWNEEFRLRHEDPMFLVKSNKASHLKTKALQSTVTATATATVLKKEKKRKEKT